MKKILITILLSFISINVYNAASSNLIVDCPTSARALSDIKCSLYIKTTNYEFSGIQFNLNFENSSYISFDINKNYTSYASNSNGVVLKRNEVLKQDTKDLIGTLNVKMPQSNTASISFSNIISSDSNYNEYEDTLKKINIRVKSSENRLSNIILSQGTLQPIFDSNITNYVVNTESDKITITATSLDKTSTITGTGTKTLKYGKNTFNITCTSELGIKRIYVLNINRKDTRDNNNYLKNLKVENYSITPSFNKETTTYKLNVKSNVSSVYIEAQTESNKSNFVSSFGSRIVNLKYGNNDVYIKVKSENEQIRTYTIKIEKEDSRSSNNYLKNIIVSSGSIDFDKNKNKYSFAVENNIDKLQVKSILDDNKSKVTENKIYDLKEGLNKIIITVTAENTEVRTYTLLVTRIIKDEKEVNNKIKSLEIEGYQINFDPDIEEYNITIENEESLNINAISEDPSSSLIINGNSNLKDGSVIKIILTAVNGSQKEYKINILKNEIIEKEPTIEVQKTVQLSKYRKLQIVLGLTSLIIMVILVIIIIILILKRNIANIGKFLT